MSTSSKDGLYRLLTWLSPSFPVGAYSYSHGIEFAIETGDITNAEDLQDWLSGVLAFGSGRVDAVLFRSSWQAIDAANDELLDWAIETGAVMRPTKEMALENSAQGAAFLETLLNSWPNAGLRQLGERLDRSRRLPAYPVVVGIASALSHINLETALTAYLHAFVSNLVSAGIRLIPLGQTAGQKIISAMEPSVLSVSHAITNDALGHLQTNIGSAAIMVDWSSMKHETQYTRLFRS